MMSESALKLGPTDSFSHIFLKSGGVCLGGCEAGKHKTKRKTLLLKILIVLFLQECTLGVLFFNCKLSEGEMISNQD
jgi:hypothetical protein